MWGSRSKRPSHRHLVSAALGLALYKRHPSPTKAFLFTHAHAHTRTHTHTREASDRVERSGCDTVSDTLIWWTETLSVKAASPEVSSMVLVLASLIWHSSHGVSAYLCGCMSLCEGVNMYVSLWVCGYVCVFVRVWICMCLCECVDMYVSLWVCGYVGFFVSVCAYVCVSVWVVCQEQDRCRQHTFRTVHFKFKGRVFPFVKEAKR